MTKTIFITGASRGLGRIWTEAFLAGGHQLIVAVRNTDSLKELSDKYPSTLLVLPLDVTDKDACFKSIAKAKAHFGKIDVLIKPWNNLCKMSHEITNIDIHRKQVGFKKMNNDL